VVIGIIGLLVALIIPAVQAAREAGRRTTCLNQLKQLSTAVLLHEEAHGHFPTGGWDWSWVGDPDFGFGAQQPGGWVYNSLPYMEQNDLHQLGIGMRYPEEKQAHAQRITSFVDGLLCPSRRSTKFYPVVGPPANGQIINAGPYDVTSRIDYAINAGDVDDVECEAEFIDRGESFTDPVRGYRRCSDTGKFDGISFQQSMVRAGQVTAGLSKTYLLGEKYLAIDQYETGTDAGDNESPYTGVNVDHTRGTSREIGLFPDTLGIPNKFVFGSAHRVGFHMTMCDGSAELVSFDVDPAVHATRGSRH